MKRLLLICSLLTFASCLPKPLPTKPGDPGWGVQVTWHGHSCFSFQDSTGRTIVIDPFDDTVGYDVLSLKADALLITHPHFDHNFKAAVRPRLKSMDILESTGATTVAAGVAVIGVPSSHDAVGGDIHGHNNIYVFDLGGLRIAHFGDFGQQSLTKEQLASIGKIDVLMIPVGGVTTIDASHAFQVIKQLQPLAVFPMHYGNKRFYPLADVNSFEALFAEGQLINPNQSGIRLRRTELSEPPSVYILSPTSRNY